MTQTTLYYFFSTIAQVMAAIGALLAVFTHFKINGIKIFLLGDGKATYERLSGKDKGYDLENNHAKYLNRLRDAIFRNSIIGIQEVIKELAKKESEEKKTLETNPRGLQYLEMRFEERKSQMDKIKSLTKKSIVCAIISIFLSIIPILFVEKIYNYDWVWLIIISVLVATSLSIIYTIKGVFEGLKELEDV